MDRDNQDLPVLIGQTGPLSGQRWSISRAVMIGRDPSCEIVIPDRQVSRYHARLMPAPDGIILEDLGSKNGTHCNGQRLADPVVLQDGDMVQIAVIQYFLFLSSDATVPLDEGALAPSERHQLLHLEGRSRRVWVGQQEVLPPLSVPQFRLLQILYEQEGQVVSRQDLVNTIWSEVEAQGVSEQALDALVRRLRDRLAQVDRTHEYIITIRGHGLRLENPENE
jgi:FHA domain